MQQHQIPSISQVAIEHVGPEEAQKYLSTNYFNRRPKDGPISQ